MLRHDIVTSTFCYVIDYYEIPVCSQPPTSPLLSHFEMNKEMLQIVSKFLKPLSFLGPPFPYQDLPWTCREPLAAPDPSSHCEPHMAIPCLTKPINIICFKEGPYSLYVTVYIRTMKIIFQSFFFLYMYNVNTQMHLLESLEWKVAC